MNPIFEKKSTASILHQGEPITVLRSGRRYKLVGESHSQNLSPGQRLAHVLTIVGLVVIAFFTCGVALASKDFRNGISWRWREFKAGKQINLHYTPEEPAPWQKKSINLFVDQLRDSMAYNSHIPEQLNAASCCISIQFNHGEAKAKDIPFADRARVTKQFLFKNEDGSALTKTELIQKIETISQSLEASVETEIDIATTQLAFGCVLLHQGSSEGPIKACYYSQSTNSSLTGDSSSISQGHVNGVLKFVYAKSIDVISSDGKQMLAGPNCMIL